MPITIRNVNPVRSWLPLLMAYSEAGSAVSPESDATRQRAEGIMQRGERSQALFGEKTRAISKISDLRAECAADDWDGSGGSALSPAAAASAIAFVRAMPESLPIPEFAPEPDGSISLDWIHSKHRVFSLTLSERPRIAFAWIDGSGSGHGVAGFQSNNIPLVIVEGIERILGKSGNGNT